MFNTCIQHFRFGSTCQALFKRFSKLSFSTHRVWAGSFIKVVVSNRPATCLKVTNLSTVRFEFVCRTLFGR